MMEQLTDSACYVQRPRSPWSCQRWKANWFPHQRRSSHEETVQQQDIVPELGLPSLRRSDIAQVAHESRHHNEEQRRSSNRRRYFQHGQHRMVRPAKIGTPSLQHRSILFRLPLEVRQLVYEALFGSSLIHILDTTTQIDTLGHRISHYVCNGPPPWHSFQAWNIGRHHHGTAGHEGSTMLNSLRKRNDHLLALCLTCRLV